MSGSFTVYARCSIPWLTDADRVSLLLSGVATFIMSLHLSSSVNAGAYRADIDGLRALAVLAVVAFHIGVPGFSGGFVGVDIFFVISGYLISSLLRQELLSTGRIDFKAFYARRFRRLAPALMMMVLGVLLLAYFVLLPDDQNKLGREIRGVALLSANLHFLQHAFDYFNSASDLTVMLHTWSLAVEEQYYLAWPLLLWGLYCLSSRNVSRVVRSLPPLLWLILCGSLAYCLWLSYHETPRAFYLMPTRAWEFAAGALVAISSWPQACRRYATTLGGVGMVLLLGSVCWLDEGMIFPGVIVLLPVLGSVMFLLAGQLDASNVFSRFAGRRPWTSIGILSYGFYLWHWPLLALGRYWGIGERSLPRDFLLGGIVALVLAWLSYCYVEQPIRQKKLRLFAETGNTLRSGFAMILLLWLLGNIAMFLLPRMPWSGHQPLLQAKQDAMFMHGNCAMPRDGLPLSPVAQCVEGQRDGPVKLLAWGDSHTDHLMPLYELLARQEHIAILRRVYHGCPPLAEVTPVGEGKLRSWCTNFSRAVRDELPLLQQQGVSGVLMNVRWTGYAALNTPGENSIAVLPAGLHGMPTYTLGWQVGIAPLDRTGSLAVLEHALADSAGYLQQLGLKLVLVLPEPEMHRSAPECVIRLGAAACNISRQKAEAERADVVAMLRSVASRYTNVRIWDGFAHFCDTTTCYASQHGKILYQDKNHITASMARSMAADFKTTFDWALQALPRP